MDAGPRNDESASFARTLYVFDVGFVGIQSVWEEETDEDGKIQLSRGLRLRVVRAVEDMVVPRPLHGLHFQ